MIPRVLLLGLALATAAALPLRAQPGPAAAPSDGAVRLFLDCSGFYCEPEYYQTEIAFATHVRDRSDADVHVLVTREQTGTEGMRYTLAFLGQGRFAGDTATLHHVTEPGMSEERRRQGLAQAVRLGLVRYAARTPAAARLTVAYEAPAAAEEAAAPARDPWNAWTFRVSGNGWFNGEQRYSYRTGFGTVSAARVTETWKLRLSVNGSESVNRFEVDSVTTYTNRQSSSGISGLLVRSLGPHLSAGITASASRSTFFNQDLALRVAPAVEYNVYPYAESTRRQLTLRYSVGPVAYDYDTQTIFGRTSETRAQQSIVAALATRQPWGSINVAGEAASFLDDVEQHRLMLSGGVELNLVRGLALNVNGSYERLRDQIYLEAGDLSEDEVLLRRRQLATGFVYYGSVGLSYTFGSRFSPVVNPRFGSTGGGGMVIIN